MAVHNGNRRLSVCWHNALWLVAGLLLAAALLFAAKWEADRHKQMEMASFMTHVADIARISESIIGGQLHEFDNSLLVLRDAYAADPKRFAENVELLRGGPLVDRELLVVLVDREGYLLYTDTPNVKPRLFLGDRKYFRFFADGGRDSLYIDAPTFGRVTKRYTLPLARPIYDRQGAFLGVVALSVKQDSITNFGSRLQLLGDATITVVNIEGALISRSHDLAKVQGQHLQPELLASILKGPEGVFAIPASSDNTERIVAYRRIHDEETLLIVYVDVSPVDVLRETSQQRAVLMFGAGFTSLVIMVLIAVYLKGRKITARLIDTLRRGKEQEYEILTGTSLDGFLIADNAGRILDTNDTFCTMLGYTQEEFLGLSVMDIEVAESPGQVASYIRTAMEAGSDRIQSRYRRKDGMIIDVEISAQYVKDSDGRFFVFVHDITDRKRAEENLHKSEGHLRTLVQTIPDLVWLKDPDGVYLSCNQMFERLYGARETDIVGKTDYDFVTREIADFFRDHDRKAIAAGKPSSNEEWLTFADDGHTILVETIKTPMYDNKGRLIGVLGIGRDITERRKAEEDKIKLEGQLQQAQKMEAIGQLAGGVAHDFNNMLGVILGHAEMVMDQVDPAQPIFADLEEIRRAAERSADITRQLLAFARKQTVAPKVLDLNETVEGMLKMLRRLIGEDIDLAWLPGTGLWQVKIDPSQIDQILANLCVNARSAITGVGKITVETGNSILDEEYCATRPGFVPGEYVRIVVSDNGCGMPKETLNHIFEPFFTTKGVGEGTGLGLATVYGAVKQNKGFLNAYSEPGQGTSFTIYLPRYMGTTGQAQLEEATDPVARGDETILLVEDEPTILNMATKMLRRLGYTVLAAGTPGKAIQLVAEFDGEIHLVMTDVIMPEMNGRILTDRLLANKPGLKCLFMSGYTANIIATQGVLDEGMTFIQKPFSKKELAAKVREALEG